MEFDIFVGIDWSGAKYPLNSHSISLSWCQAGDTVPYYLEGPLSRRDVANWIIDKAANGLRIFIGIDCNLGYSANIIAQQFGQHASASDLWDEVDRLNRQDANFNSNLFWNDQQYKKYFWTYGQKPDWYDQQSLRRLTEKECILQGLGFPECSFKLIGPKQVGKGGLSGMRLVKFLSDTLKDRICIWPFQTAQSVAQIVMCEIYPRLFWNKAGIGNVKVTDIESLNKALHYFGSQPVLQKSSFTDHNSDAMITAAGMRYYIQSDMALHNLFFDIPISILPLVKSEGWIFGVNTQRCYHE